MLANSIALHDITSNHVLDLRLKHIGMSKDQPDPASTSKACTTFSPMSPPTHFRMPPWQPLTRTCERPEPRLSQIPDLVPLILIIANYS